MTNKKLSDQNWKTIGYSWREGFKMIAYQESTLQSAPGYRVVNVPESQITDSMRSDAYTTAGMYAELKSL